MRKRGLIILILIVLILGLVFVSCSKKDPPGKNDIIAIPDAVLENYLNDTSYQSDFKYEFELTETPSNDEIILTINISFTLVYQEKRDEYHLIGAKIVYEETNKSYKLERKTQIYVFHPVKGETNTVVFEGKIPCSYKNEKCMLRFDDEYGNHFIHLYNRP